MPNLKEVKGRIKSVKSTQQITKAMKMVAASKLRRAQDNILQMRPYAEKLFGILANVTASSNGEAQSIFAESRDVNKVLLVVITSDKGLCGAFNSNIFKTAIRRIDDYYTDQKENGHLWVLPLGKKSYEFFKKRKFQVIGDYYDIFQHLSFEKAKEVAEFVLNGFAARNFDQVDLVYNEFKNVATQIQRVENYLPVEKEEDEYQQADNIDYIIEPSVEYIIQELIPQTLKIQFYKALLESNASEHGARMTAMDKATENAGELLKDLTLMYNRTRQAAITKEILEIVGGAEALAKG